jgi:DNA-binding FadR family transcriptional regulator
MEARRELEPILARLAALRGRRDDIVAMRRFGQRAEAASDAEAREAWDSALHRQIAEAAGNTVLLALFDVIDRVRQDPTWRSLRERARSRERLVSYVEEHDRLIAAIADRNAPAAEAAMRDHLDHVAANLASAMAGNAPQGSIANAAEGADGRTARR